MSGNDGNQQGDQQGSGESGAGQGQQNGEKPQSWEKWLEEQSDEVRALYGAHTSGLRSALQSEREQRGDLAKELRDATKTLEEGSDAREALERATGRLDAAVQRADFFQDAARPEIGCTNPKLAFLGAQEVEAFDRRGNVNWGKLKEEFPELFGQQGKPTGNAGSGTGGDPPKTFDMNTAIRAAAGRAQ